MKELILKNEVNKENTVLDMTLGMKTISIAFYRIAVERQIKAINWNEKFLSSYTQISENEFKENEKGQKPRIALSAKLSLMREPIKESLHTFTVLTDQPALWPPYRCSSQALSRALAPKGTSHNSERSIHSENL